MTVVKENEAGVSQQSLAKKYGVARSTIKNWCYQYQMYGEAGIENSSSKRNIVANNSLHVPHICTTGRCGCFFGLFQAIKPSFFL